MEINNQKLSKKWQEDTIDNLCFIVNGKTPLRSNKEYWIDGNIPWFTIDDQRKQGRTITRTNQFITQKALQKSGVKLVPKNSILLCCTASVGEYAITRIPLTTNQQFNSLIIKDKEKMFSDYLFQYSAMITKKLNSIMGKTTFGFVSVGMLGSIKIKFPDLKTQQRIALILSTVDEEIQKTVQIIEKTEKLKNKLTDNLLTKGLSHNLFKKTKFGDVPINWKVKKMEDIVDGLMAGVSVNSENVTIKENENGILKTSAVTYGIFNPNEHKKIIEKDINRARVNPKKDHIIFSRMNTPLLVGASVYIDKDYPNLFLPDRLWQFEFKNDSDISPKWLSYFLGWNITRERICNMATGTSASMKNISKEKLMNLEIVCPIYKEQLEIAKILDNISKKISSETIIKNKLIQLKNGLMNDIFNQKIQIN